MFEITSKYRTIHSLNDEETTRIISFVEEFQPKIFLDYGCHLGHLSFELASRYDMTIYAVDNFTGTVGDEKMQHTIANLTNGTMDFMDLFKANMNAVRTEFPDGFKGRILPYRTEEFYALSGVELDMAFVDSSHRVEETDEFEKIDNLIKPGGVLVGHDYHDQWSPGVIIGVDRIIKNYTWIQKDYLFAIKKNNA